MCGIAGIVRLDGAPVAPLDLAAQMRALSHRGPDGDGLWINSTGEMGLAHRRLAILDLSPAAAQPMHYSGRFTITYNGEIYNYLELRDLLRGRGFTFQTASDTEVLLAAYAEYGPSCISLLDGMFAFALWDERERTLFCARDRFGEKPFFFHHVPGRHFIFASEMKGLFAAGVPASVNRRLLYLYLAYDVVQDPSRPADTFYADVESLPPATTLTIRDGTLERSPHRYWQLPQHLASPVPSLAVAAERVRELLSESIRRRLRSDVPIGTSLSGGLDSSSIVCLVPRLGREPPTVRHAFSARFTAAGLDEGTYIEEVARSAGVANHYTWPDATGLARDLESVFYHQEEPFGSASIYAQWTVMRLAKEVGATVLLDGQGPDEMLGGYPHLVALHLRMLYHTDRPRFEREARAFGATSGLGSDLGWRSRLEVAAPRLLRRLGAWRRAVLPTRALSWLSRDYSHAHRREPPPFRQFPDLPGLLRFFTEDYGLRNLLRYADRNAMAFGREIRLPFLSHPLVEFLFTLPDDLKVGGGETKRVLRAAVAGIVPESVRRRTDKIGMDTPQREWLDHPAMASLLADAKSTLVSQGLLSARPVPKAVEWRVLMASLLVRAAAGGAFWAPAA
jgi:asparagine synthase (glutamine-hydrolysing)